MLINVKSVADLRSLARARSRSFETKSVHAKLIEEEAANGWTVLRKGKVSVRLSRPKPHGTLLEDRVWTLLYKMQFDYLSDKGGAKLPIDLRAVDGPNTQIDVVGIEADIALAIECKSQEQHGKRSGLSAELAKLSEQRERFARACNSGEFAGPHKRHTALAFFLFNVELTKNDRERAAQLNIVLFDQADLGYYEKLVAHLGPAAKYQFFADMLPGKAIAGLQIRVPCVRSKLGNQTCYCFPLSPEYLLKISYVSHRTKGKRSDVDTYQRMLAKSRLNKIRQYISDNGVFPTNIVVNLETRRLSFQRIKQDNTKDDQRDSGVLGWLDIKAAYKSAWIIDGQHRLYAYSGHPRSASSHLSVLAFEGLPPSKQAQMFIDINAKQKSVKQSLLQELFAELHWDSDKDSTRVQAIISKAVQILDSDPTSPLCGRVQTADASKDNKRCISLTSIFNALEKTDFYIVREKKGQVTEFGPLWAVENETTLERTLFVVKKWLLEIRSSCIEWWDLGAADGGGLAMNDGVTACIKVLESVLQHLQDTKRAQLIRLDNEDLWTVITPFAKALGTYFASMTGDERKAFRDLRGNAGQATRTRRCQRAVRQVIKDFNPTGLDDFIQREHQQTNLRAKEVTDKIERELQRVVIEELKREFGENETSWWTLGVPKAVRLEVAKREQADDSRRGSKEAYFDLVDYRAIALEHWELFEALIAHGAKGSKDKRTKWIVEVNEKRNIVAHPSSGVLLSIEQLTELQGYERSLMERIEGRTTEEPTEESDAD